MNQLLQLRDYASQGWDVVTEYTDQASAKNGSGLVQADVDGRGTAQV